MSEALRFRQDLLHLPSIEYNYGASQLTIILITKFLVEILCIGFYFTDDVVFPALIINILFPALFSISISALLRGQDSRLSVYAISDMVALAIPIIGAPLALC